MSSFEQLGKSTVITLFLIGQPLHLSGIEASGWVQLIVFVSCICGWVQSTVFVSKEQHKFFYIL